MPPARPPMRQPPSQPPPRGDVRATAPARPSAAGSTVSTKDENIYIPSFISRKPFYADEQATDYLEHQRMQKKSDHTTWYERGKKAGPAATKYRKGACENCGAMTHKAKDCLSRPRAKGAKWTGRDIEADEIVQDVQLGWDAKRDRWNGFHPKDYRAVVDDYNQKEELRKELQSKTAAQEGREIEESDHYAEESDMSKHQPTSTRQLRLREDTAKYLLNLDAESAKYDPKTRSIVDAGAAEDKVAELYAEEGFLKASGDAAEFEKATRLAWEAQERTGNTGLHLQANPTAAEHERRKEKEAAEKKQQEYERMLREKYGAAPGEDVAAAAALKALAVTESEHFVEYDELGLIKGAPSTVARSKYREDVYNNNHTSVWGSWWSNSRWGYACCHSLVRNSYCTGEEGKRAWEEAERQRTGVGLIEDEDGDADDSNAKNDTAEAKEDRRETWAETKKSSGPVAKKRTLEEMMGGVSEAEMDEYRRKRTAADDPMAKYLGKDELVH